MDAVANVQTAPSEELPLTDTHWGVRASVGQKEPEHLTFVRRREVGVTPG